MNTNSSTVEKALKIIEYIFEKKSPKGIHEISKDLVINTSTVQRIVNTLNERKYFSQDPLSKKYFLGFKFLEISKTLLEQIDLRNIAHPYLKKLRDTTQETVHLMVLDSYMGVYIDTLESPQRIKVVTDVGTKDELHFSAIGKAILAYLPSDELDQIIKVRGLQGMTEKTITDAETLKKELTKIKIKGYSIDNEEGEIGTKCIGAPIFRHNGKVDTAISLAAPSLRLTKEKMGKYITLVMETAQNISKEIGYI